MADHNPFIEHRHHLDLYRRAIERGMTDADYRAMVTEADSRIAVVDGAGFTTTPLVTLVLDEAGSGPGTAPVLAKVETANVGGSHKARHLFGLLLHLLVDERAPDQLASGADPRADLAIASCGNAALGAAIVARSAERKLRVFVPTHADEAILRRLDALAADIVTCPRTPGEKGDPCLAGLEAALAAGAQPFTVQGPLCPSSIDGGRTLGLELAAQLDEVGTEPAGIYIQVGGGALATAVMDGLGRARPDRRLPRLHPVQARTAHPYVAGWRRIRRRLTLAVGCGDADDERASAERLRLAVAAIDLEAELEALAPAMTPWPEPPHSVASGILDDLTYDWRTVMAHQVRTGGWPIVVDEATFVAARRLAAAQVAPAPDETGAAGLAGLLEHRRTDPATADETAVVLLTGAARSDGPP